MAGELELAKGLKTTTNVPADAWRGPYANVAAACAAIITAMRLYRTVDVVTDGAVTEYWWREGTGDTDLVLKTSGGSSSTKKMAAGTIFWDVPAETILTGLWFQAGTACSIGVGYSLSDTDLCDTGDLAANGDLLFQVYKPFRSATRIYFNGIAEDTIPIIYFL